MLTRRTMNTGRLSWIVVALGVLAVPLLAFFALRAETNSQDVGTWLPSSTSQRQVYDDFAQLFGVDEAVVISWDGCRVDDPRLASLKRNLENPSINQGLIAKVTSGAEVLKQLTSDAIGLSTKSAKRRLEGVLFGKDRETTCLVVRMNDQGRAKRKQSMIAIRTAIDRVDNLELADVHMGGNTYISCEVDRESSRSLIYAIPGALLAFAVTWFFLGSFRLACIAIFVAGLSALTSVAVVVMTGAKVNGLLVLMPILVLVLALSGTIHLINYYKAAIREKGVGKAVGIALSHGRRPCVLAMATTSIGIGSLCVSQIEAVRHFGLYSAVGLLLALDLLLILLPALLTVWKPSPSEVRRIRRRKLTGLATGWTDRFSAGIVRYAIPLSIVGFLTLIPSVMGLSKLETILDIERMFAETSAVRQNYNWIEENVAALEAVEVLVEYPDGAALPMVDQVSGVKSIQAAIARRDDITSTYSIANYIKSIPKGTRIRDNIVRDALNDELTEGQQELISQRFLANDRGRNIWRIRASVGATDTDYGRLVAQLKEMASGHAKKLEGTPEITITGIWPLAASGHKLLFGDLTRSFALAFVLITPVMMFVLGGVLKGLTAMIPNVVPPIVVFGMMGVFGIPADVGAILTASVGLGIAVDDTLHFLEWYRSANSVGDKTHATKVAFSRCSAAMTQTTLICCAGLASFGLSNFVPVQLFSMTIIVLLATRANPEQPFGKAVNLGPSFNTPGGEYCPFLTADGQTLFFVAVPHPDGKRSRPGAQGGRDIYQAPITIPTTTLPNGWEISAPVNLGPAVNSRTGEHGPSLSADGLTLVFTSHYRDGESRGIYLWACTRSGPDQPWGKAVKLGPAVNSDRGEYDSCLAADGQSLLFSSKRPGGEGGMDLWACSRTGVDQPWGKAVNLGPVVNSPDVENAPFLSADGRVLLFHSNRPGGHGGFDLWMARRDRPDQEFGEPVNLGPTVNSPQNDKGPCLSHDGLTLLFSSNRLGGKGWDDLWMATRSNTKESFGRPVNLGPKFNTAGNENGPLLTADGQTLFFVADQRSGGEGSFDIYQASITAPTTTLPNGWEIGEPVNLGPAVNTSGAEHSPCLSADGLTLLFGANHRSGIGGGTGYIWASKRPSVNQPWGEAVRLDHPVRSGKTENSPHLSADGLTLLFASKRPGGEGDFDLWWCSRPNENQPWGKPVNLGAAVNSLHTEQKPFLSADGCVLLFHSNRPGGQGALDLWIARREDADQEFGEPVNLGPTVNSSYNDKDPCLTRDGLTLLFSSDRPGSRGRDDLWMATRSDKEQPFGKPVNLGPKFNTPGSENSPFLTADGQTLFFVVGPRPDGRESHPGAQGGLDIYQAPIRAPRRPADPSPSAVTPGANSQSQNAREEAREGHTDDAEFTLLRKFDDDLAIKPYGPLVLHGDTLCGSAFTFDPYESVVYSVKTDGSDPRILHRFSNGETRGWVSRELTLAGDRLYGTTDGDGEHKKGTVFAVNTDGSNFTVLHSFKDDLKDGTRPRGKLVVQGTNLYGVTHFGGSGEDSEGTVYAMNTDGSGFRLLHSFEYEKGCAPANLWLHKDTLYGVTSEGGNDDVGVAFSIATDGTEFRVLHHLSLSDRTRWFDLAAYEDSVLAIGAGVVRRSPMDISALFALDMQTGRLRVLHEFVGGADDGHRLNDARLVGDTIFGTTDGGGPANCGTVFSIQTDGSNFRLLHAFDKKTGMSPEGVTIAGSTLYGATPLHDGKNRGTVYSLRLPHQRDR